MTGLGISLLKEVAIDNIPSIIIDPKGDMGNLLLTIYPPRSNAGVSVALLKSFKASTSKLMQDNDLFTSHVNAIVRSLLSLIRKIYLQKLQCLHF
jgi:hypothetical protein